MSISAWGVDHGVTVSKAAPMSPERKAARRSNRKVESEYTRKYGDRGSLIGAGAVGGAVLARPSLKPAAYGARAAVKLKRQGNSTKQSAKAGKNFAGYVKSKRRPGIIEGPIMAGALALTGGGIGAEQGQKYGRKKAKQDSRYIRGV